MEINDFVNSENGQFSLVAQITNKAFLEANTFNFPQLLIGIPNMWSVHAKMENWAIVLEEEHD